MSKVKTSSFRLDPLTELGVGGRDSLKEEEDDGDRVTLGRLGDVRVKILLTDGDVCTIELDRLGGQPKEEVEETEKAEVRHVEGVKEAEKSQGDDKAEDGAEDETIDEIEPREERRLPARPRLKLGERSFPGRTRQT